MRNSSNESEYFALNCRYCLLPGDIRCRLVRELAFLRRKNPVFCEALGMIR